MREVLNKTIDVFGTLDGVIHGAGIVSPDTFKVVPQLDQSLCRLHFNPKIHGTLVLYNLLQDRNLDFVLLLSSLSAVLGGLGFTAYAAANIFMDSFVEKV